MNLLRAFVTVSAMTLLSRILGFVRDFVIALSFGAGMATDAFFVAFRLPNLLRRMFAEGAFSQAFVPILAEFKNSQNPAATKQLIDRVATLLTLVVASISAIGIVLAPGIILVSAPGFAADSSKFALTVTLTRITFPYILFISLVALAAGILNTWNRFSIPAFTPVLLNLAFIGMALFAAPYFDPPVLALAWAVILGGGLQLLLQIRPLLRLRLLPRFDFNYSDSGVRRVASLMLPAMLGVSVAQISLLLNTVFASFLQDGSVSWLYYADRLMEFPAGLLGAALGTILLPSLSKLHADSNAKAFSAMLDWGLRLTFILTLPAALALAMLATPLISTLFQHGAFHADDVIQTRHALVAYSLGLTGLIAVKILAPAFYARQNIRTPVRIAIVSLVATQLMNLLFVFGLSLQHAGLALSIGLASLLNAGLLFFKLQKANIYRPCPGWLRFFARLGVGLAVLAACLALGLSLTGDWHGATAAVRVAWLSALVVAGLASYFLSLYLLGFRMRDFQRQAIH